MFIRIMLIRMNVKTLLAAPIAALAVAGCTTAVAAGPDHDRTVIVLGGTAAQSPAQIAQAQAVAERTGARNLRGDERPRTHDGGEPLGHPRPRLPRPVHGDPGRDDRERRASHDPA